MHPAHSYTVAALGFALTQGIAFEVASAQRFVPPSSFLSVEYPEYGGGPVREYTAQSYSEITVLSESPETKIVWSVADQPTTATRTSVAGLFVLSLKDGLWVVSDVRRFECAGIDSGAHAKLTSHGYAAAPHVTVTLLQGGRGESWEQTVSYVVRNATLIAEPPTAKLVEPWPQSGSDAPPPKPASPARHQ